jgi:hypothetical protein
MWRFTFNMDKAKEQYGNVEAYKMWAALPWEIDAEKLADYFVKNVMNGQMD